MKIQFLTKISHFLLSSGKASYENVLLTKYIGPARVFGRF